MDRIDKDEELVCPLCGGRLFWMPVSLIYACEHCKQSYSERNGVYMRKKRESTAEKSSAVGDAAKLREALENSNGLLEELAAMGEWGESAREQIAENNAALAEPVRNYEVGTAEEQEARYNKFCGSHKSRHGNCFGCPALRMQRKCEIVWAQMPYEEGGAK